MPSRERDGAVKGFLDKRYCLRRNRRVSAGCKEVTVVAVDDKKGTEMGKVVDFELVQTGKVCFPVRLAVECGLYMIPSRRGFIKYQLHRLLVSWVRQSELWQTKAFLF